MNEEISVSEKLRALRRSKGMTVNELAEKMGENHQKVGRLERGQGNLTVDYLFKVTEALATPVDQFLQGSTPPKSPKPSLSGTSILSYIVLQVEKSGKKYTSDEKAELISSIFSEAEKFPPDLQKQVVDSILAVRKSS